MSNINLNMKELDQEKLAELDKYIESLEDPKGTLINVLHRAQTLFGYIPHNLQLYVAKELDLTAARVNGVVTFYSYFSEEKTGKHLVSVCMGTACYVKGSEKVLKKCLDILKVKKGQMTDDGLFTIKDVRCIGACGLAPILSVGDKIYGHVKEDMVEDILEKYRGESNGN